MLMIMNSVITMILTKLTSPTSRGKRTLVSQLTKARYNTNHHNLSADHCQRNGTKDGRFVPVCAREFGFVLVHPFYRHQSFVRSVTAGAKAAAAAGGPGAFFVAGALVLLALVGGTSFTAAQTVSARISVLSTTSPRVRVEGVSKTATRDFSFLPSYAGAQGLGQRVENFRASDTNGKEVKVTRLAPGEYVAEPSAVKWSYEVELQPPASPDDAVYVSWLTAERGLLLPKDLLPLPVRTPAGREPDELSLTISPPAGWRVATAETAVTPEEYRVRDWSASVFFVSPELRQTTSRVDRVNFSVTTSGSWEFTDQDVSKLAVDALRFHQETVKDGHPFDAMLIVAPYPAPQVGERWSAETRGRTVVLLSGRVPVRFSAVGMLSVSLSHELFHLWVPNRLNLDGEYAWFYEGFTLYQALRCGAALGFFTLSYVLDVVARMYDSYRPTPFAQLSLLQAGERRWTGGNALIYSKGLVVAFLLDGSLRLHGKRSLAKVYRELLDRHGPSQPPAPANSTLLALLQSDRDSADLIRRFVVGSEAIDLGALVASLGLTFSENGGKSALKIGAKLTGRQKEFLAGLGYR